MLLQYYLYLQNWIEEKLRPQEGQDLSEYAILVGIVAVIVVGTILAIGGKLNEIFQKLLGVLEQAAGGS